MIESIPKSITSSESLTIASFEAYLINGTDTVINVLGAAFLISFSSSTHKPDISSKSGNFLDSARFLRNRSLFGLSQTFSEIVLIF